MPTLKKALQVATQKLADAGQDFARREAEYLLMDALGLGRSELLLKLEDELSHENLLAIQSYLRRRLKGEPLAQIHGRVEFYDLDLELTADVLIPRPETELLVDLIAEELETSDLEGKVLWDICCGSGCMGLALKKRFPHLHVVLSDLSPKALAVAKRNAERNQLDVELRQGDLLAPFHGEVADIVVSNPPYLAEEEYPGLDPEVRDFEPKMALVSGETGLEIYERLAQGLPALLLDGGKLYLEIGYRQGAAVKELFAGEAWKACQVLKDLAGHERFVKCFNAKTQGAPRTQS